MKSTKIILLLLAMSMSLFAGAIKVEDAYARATPPSLPNSASFMSITNHSDKDIALLSASSTIAKNVELHTHDMKNGAMMMYQVPQIDIKANSTTVLKPGGFHVMLIGLNKKPLKEGQTVDLKLSFSNGETLSLTMPVKTVMGGMMKKKGMSCGQGKCGSSMKKGMSCGQGKCGKSMKEKTNTKQPKSQSSSKTGTCCQGGKCGASKKKV